MTTSVAALTEDTEPNLRNLRLSGLNQGFEKVIAERAAVTKTAGDLVADLVETGTAAQAVFTAVSAVSDLLNTASLQWRTPATFLNETEDVEELLILGRQLLSEHVADRLSYLRSLESDLESGQAPMSVSSLRNFMQFMISRRRLSDPSIAVIPDGNIQAEWHAGKHKHFVIQFVPNRLARYAAVAPNARKPDLPKRMSGILPLEEVLQGVSPGRVVDWIQNEG